MDDQEAIRQMKHGKISGLENLVNKYQIKALRAAFLVMHNEALAEDVVQDTFIRFYQRVKHFDENRSVEPYLMRSMVNAALNAVRRDRKRISLDSNLAQFEGLLTQATSVESQVEFNQLSEKILASLSQLTPQQRAVIVQRYYLEMSEAEMAQALDIAPGTVKWLLHAARNRLRDIFGAERSKK